MTLTGTRTYVLGAQDVVIIDPGSNHPVHLEAIGEAIGAATVSCIVLTHLHPDHESGSDTLAKRFRSRVRAIGRGTLAAGDVVESDAGALVTVHTPGHTPDHASFHWPAGNAVFCGDLMMGGLDTALVASGEGDLRAWLASLEVLRTLAPAVIHPAHGPSFKDPIEAIDAYVRHRGERLRQVRVALEAGPSKADEVAEAVYGGTIPPELREVAVAAVRAYLDYLAGRGIVDRRDDVWVLRPTPGPA